jgi:hypothetical protein
MIKTSALNLFLCCIYSNAFAYTVEYAPQCFAKIQNHELGEIVVQDSIVHLPMGPAYTLQSGSGYIVGNRFYADQYGRNVIEGSDGKTHEIFCHFSSVKIAGGDARRLVGRKLDRIQDFAELMRFHPGVGKTDPQGPMAAGPHTTIEPRLYLDSRGILYCAYHVKDHTFRSDAATGMGLVVSASWDRGKTWKDVWYENHRDGVLGYPAFCEVGGTVHLYFNGSHTANKSKRHWQGIQRITTTDGVVWSKMERMDGLNTLLTGAPDGTALCLTQNALTIPNMTWKGVTGTAILLPHYHAKITISMDGGKSWNLFFQGDVFWSKKPDANLMDEISLELTKDREIYVISRLTKGHKLKNEFLIGLDGQLIERWQKSHLAPVCNHGTEMLPDGRVLYSTVNGTYRECAAIGLSSDLKNFDTRQLFTGGGWGYSDACYSPTDKAFLIVGECEPMVDGAFLEMPAHFMGGNDNERLSIRLFKLSEHYFRTVLPPAPDDLIPYTDQERQSRP